MRTIYPTCILAVAVIGCGPEQDRATGEHQDELNGTVTFPTFEGTDISGCNASQKSKIQAAMAVVVGQILTAPEPMRACLREVVLSGSDSAYAEDVVAKLQQNLPTVASCADLAAGVAAQAPVGISSERITFDRGYLDGNTPQEIGALTLHELGHNKGYTHHDTARDPSALGAFEYDRTVNQQLRLCSYNAAGGAGVRRSNLRTEVELSPVGRGGGAPFLHQCSLGKFVYSLQLRADSRLSAMGFDCRLPGGAGGAETGGLHGGSAGTASAQTCAPGEVAVGVTGRADSTINALGLLCATEDSVRFDAPIITQSFPPRGNTSGVVFRRECPAGMALDGVLGRSGSRVDRLRLECRSFSTPARSVSEVTLPRMGVATGSSRYEETEICTGRSAMVGFDGTADNSGLPRLAAKCQHLQRECPAGAVGCYQTMAYPFSSDLLLPGHGSWNGDWFGNGVRCAPDEALVGFDFFATTFLHGVWGVCADTESWTRRDRTPSEHTLPFVGAAIGSVQQRRCDRGSFAVGYKIGVGDDHGKRVTFLDPICRGFDTMYDCPGGCSRQLQVATSGSGSGYVTSNPTGISCGGSCSATFGWNEAVRLTPVAAAGSVFNYWVNGCDWFEGSDCVIVLANDRSIIADFAAIPPPDPVCDYDACVEACRAECLLEPLHERARCRNACPAACEC